MVTDAELAAEWEKECLAQISYHQRSIGEMNALREQFCDDWEIEELTRAIIFDEAQLIEMFTKEVEGVREARKKLG